MSPTKTIFSSGPITTRLGLPLIILLAGVTMCTSFAAAWIPDGPRPWGNWVLPALMIMVVLLAGYFTTKPSRARQPAWAKGFAIMALSGAILVPLLALFPAATNPGIGVWVMALIAVAESILLIVAIALTLAHQQHSA